MGSKIVKEGKKIYIKKVKKSYFRNLLKHSEKVAKKLWSNKEDNVWDNI